LAWRRKLAPAEEARLQEWLAAHPEDAADWEAETTLNGSLARLPDASVPSNFTALVLQEVQRQRRPGSTRPWWLRLAWLPRVAFVGVVVGLGVFTYHQVQESERREFVRSVSVLSQVASVPSPEILKDFEAINVLDRTPPADEELLKLLQ
jgi:anti-sigma factor RsiW